MKTIECAYKRQKLEIRALISHFSFCKRKKNKRERKGSESLGFGKKQFRHIKSLSKITKFGRFMPKSFIVILHFTEVDLDLNSLSYL